MKIAIATGTRADWGLLSPLASSLQREGHNLLIYATNAHLNPRLGDTWKEIEADGFHITRKIRTDGSRTEVASAATKGFGEAFGTDRPDCVVILGDRFEMLGVATAATLEVVPVVHIAGGTVSEGAIDDAIRHAITKLSYLHLVETPDCRRRVIQMGEAPERVIHTGAIGVWNAISLPVMSRDELQESLGYRMPEETFVVTLHPATLSLLSPEEQMRNLISALAQFPDFGYIITYPNNDTDPEPLISLIEEFAERNPNVRAIASLGRRRYMSALAYAKGVIGNSSSGLVEVPSTGIPTLDIGIRQKGREHGPSVVHCGDYTDEIVEGIKRIVSPDIRELAAKKINPYYLDDTPGIMTRAISSAHFSPFPRKTFHNL